MAMPDIPPEVAKSVPGALGSLFALLWIKDTWPRRLAMFVGGAVLSRFGTDPVSKWLGMTEGLTGFLLGLFGMAVVAKIFETWAVFDLGGILRDWVRKVLGLPAVTKE